MLVLEHGSLSVLVIVTASILQTQAVLKEQLARCVSEGVRLGDAINNRFMALEQAKRETKQILKEKEAVKNDTKRYRGYFCIPFC